MSFWLRDVLVAMCSILSFCGAVLVIVTFLDKGNPPTPHISLVAVDLELPEPFQDCAVEVTEVNGEMVSAMIVELEKSQ